MERAVAGDSSALTVLLTNSHAALRRRMAARIPADVLGEVDADDVLQDAYTRAFRAIERFEPRGPDAFDRWIATIATRQLRSAIKRRRALKRGGGRREVGAGGLEESVACLLDLIESSDRSPSRVAAAGEGARAVQTALRELPQDYQAVVRLVYLDGASVADAAARLGRTDRAVHNMCYKAKLKLRDLLGRPSRYLNGGG
jgi:RNA polymerase sigma-70 factor (ECF subfamily)